MTQANARGKSQRSVTSRQLWQARKRRETRQKIRSAGLELFAKYGYEEVTSNQIAQHAGVSQMTFFRYFPAKEDVVLSMPQDCDFIEQALCLERERNSSQMSPLDALQDMRAAFGLLSKTELHAVALRMQLVRDTPSLTDALYARAPEWARAFAEIHAPNGEKPDFNTRLTASLATALIISVYMEWAARGKTVADLSLELLDEVIAEARTNYLNLHN